MVFGGTDEEPPLKHLGEAETCFPVRERAESAARGGSPTTRAHGHARARPLHNEDSPEHLVAAIERAGLLWSGGEK
jgi:hypothetical protein